MTNWIEYWNTDHPIYVNARHKTLHYRRLAEDVRDLIGSGGIDVLDYGCGEALSADHVAARCRRLILAEAAPAVRDKLAARFGANPAIEIATPEDVEALPAGSLDLIVVHSVAQYIDRDEFARLVDMLAGKLRPGGRIVLGDILPPGLSPLVDAGALLEFGLAGGFLIPAVMGLVRTALSDYRRIRGELGLTHYSEADIIALIEDCGLSGRRLGKNPGHNQARMAFLGTKPDEGRSGDGIQPD